ncbi:MAG: GTP-binding protein [Acidobacteriota bacterium]
MSIRPWVVLVGGFLGAGKTTLLLAAVRELETRGLRSAMILNDQDHSLVDSELASLHHVQHGAVTGGCFCCRFSQLIEVIESLRLHAPDVIFAEPVGSCTDISATTLHPLLELGDAYCVAPYTVLVDPLRAETLLHEDADPNLSFLFKKQLQEADLICLTKSDICPTAPTIPAQSVRQISARSGQGVAAWLDEVLSGQLSSGSFLLEIDYEQYARAEAALAWLNAKASIDLRNPASPAFVLGPLLQSLDADLTAARIQTVHLKAIVQAETGYVKAAMLANGQDPAVEGILDASPARHHELLLNLRAVGRADSLKEIVQRNLMAVDGDASSVSISCFHPAPPHPERRVRRD